MASKGMSAGQQWVEGNVLSEFTTANNRRKLNPAKIAKHVKAQIQNDRREMGLAEVLDWEDFCEGAMSLPTSSGYQWCGGDDPRVAKYMARMAKHKKNPSQVARPRPKSDPVHKIAEHPLRKFFSTSTDLRDPMMVAEGLYKIGRIREHDVKFTAAKIEYVPRPPIVSIMGHVDHGKTTLLDYLRQTTVAQGEAGGITQTVGAFTVKVGGNSDDGTSARDESTITFIDTPGHAAFKEMREAGVFCTDIIVLVVATTDGVQPQTLEVIEMANKHHVPIIVAANKIDRNPNIEPIKRQLREAGIRFDGEGGEVLICDISALHGTNVSELLDLIQLQASMMELVVPVPSRAEVMVCDSRSPHKRYVGAIVRCGELKPGMVLAGGMNFASVTKLFAEDGKTELKSAHPGTPVLIEGFKLLPKPGVCLFQLANLNTAQRYYELMKEVYACEGGRETYLQILQAEQRGNVWNRKPVGAHADRVWESKPFNIIVKAGTFGQLQALMRLLYELPSDIEGVHLVLKLAEVGGMDDHDTVILGGTEQPGAILVFGHTTPTNFMQLPTYVHLYQFDVVYHGIQWLKEQIVACLPKKIYWKTVARAKVLQTFRASQAGEGNAAGLSVTMGKITAAGTVRVLRKVGVRKLGSKSSNALETQEEEIYHGHIKQLRRFKAEVPSVDTGVECGMILDDGFIFRVEDIVEEVLKVEIDLDVEEVFSAAMKREEEALRLQKEAAEAAEVEQNQKLSALNDDESTQILGAA